MLFATLTSPLLYQSTFPQTHSLGPLLTAPIFDNLPACEFHPGYPLALGGLVFSVPCLETDSVPRFLTAFLLFWFFLRSLLFTSINRGLVLYPYFPFFSRRFLRFDFQVNSHQQHGKVMFSPFPFQNKNWGGDRPFVDFPPHFNLGSSFFFPTWHQLIHCSTPFCPNVSTIPSLPVFFLCCIAPPCLVSPSP